MSNPLWNVTRRDFLGTALGGTAFATLGGLPMFAWAESGDALLAGKTLNLVLRYRTDPERIARVLPPGIEPDEAADVMLDWWVRYPTPGTENIYYPGVYSECGIHVTAKYQGRRGMFQVGMPLDQEWGRSMGRENVGLVKKDGTLNIRRQGKEITAELQRRGKLLYRIKTQVLDTPAHPLYWHRETGFGAFLYRYRLNPNWKEGPLAGDPVELWLRVLGGKQGSYPQELTPGGPRACDFARTHFEFVEPSVLDPFCEFPLRSIVGMSYSETGLAPADEAAYRQRMPRTPTRVERLQFIDSKAFEPWALLNYDRPIDRGRAWIPVDWPKNTALKLDDEELERYRARASLDLELAACVDLKWRIDPSLHARTLPATFEPGTQPILRILALRVGASDVSTQPFDELWLLSRCEHAGVERWYALSNVVAANGDVVYGRETFGYPSKLGKIDWRTESRQSSIRGSRMGRDFLRLNWSKVQRHGSAVRETLEIVGLQLHPSYRVMTLNGFNEPGARADLISQPWSFELSATKAIDPQHCVLEFPAEPGPGKVGTPDPWFEFKNGTLVSARIGAGVLRRFPGRNSGAISEHAKCYSERYDGADTTELALSGDVKHTFLVR